MGEKIHIGCLFSHVMYARENTLLTRLFPHFLSYHLFSLVFNTQKKKTEHIYTEEEEEEEEHKKNVDELL